MSHILEDFKAFLDHSPTSWHAACEVGNRLALQDFIPLEEKEKWCLEPGGRYFVLRGGSLCAFSLPEKKPMRAVILASHTDSPSLKIKPNPEMQKENMLLLGVEVYGAPLLASWLSRDLGIAGRIVVADELGRVEEKLVYIDDAPLFIPQLAPHLDREVNEKGLLLNKQEHLNAIGGLGKAFEEGYLLSMLRRHLSFHSLLSFDLFLVPIEESRFLGCHSELLSSSRLDNLASAHACMTALGLVKKPQVETLQMAVFYDHEEIGSKTSEGADSPFLADLLKRIQFLMKLDEEEFLVLKNHSLCASVDMSHALNPNYPQKYDPNHQPLLGEGIVLKYNASQRYASTALSTAPILQLCRQLNIKSQSFVSRSDIASGSTVGPILAHRLGIPTVDLGCAQLSMHATRELMATQDHLDMCYLLAALLQEGEA